jgi:amino acid adenylation domain-containing protein
MKSSAIESRAMPSIVAWLRQRAIARPSDLAYTFLTDRQIDDPSMAIDGLSWGELDERARAVATAIRARHDRGERAVLLYEPGLDYIIGFFGCLYAGVTPVPAYPPDPSRLARTLPRLTAMIEDCGATVLLTTRLIAAMRQLVIAAAPRLDRLEWIESDAVPAAFAMRWSDSGCGGADIAFLQYTSGSTSSARGVCISHENLLANCGCIERAFGLSESSRGFFWLPPYHDMGLIGGILQPLFSGFPSTLISPLSFLKRPDRWVRGVSRFRATVSGGPNFSYDLLVDKVSPAELANLDLSSWSVAFCGAEPIQARTLRAFTERFSKAGLPAAAPTPCYGLAEHTLMASSARPDAPLVERAFVREALERGRAVAALAEDGRTTEPLVSSGRALEGGHEIAIVEPGGSRRCRDGEIGEVWLCGPSVAASYWGNPEKTRGTFEREIAGEPGRKYLKTGDLGFIQEGELFVTGRHDDVMIVLGRNLHPQDLERTISESSPHFRRGCCAVFAVSDAGTMRIVAVQEARSGAGLEEAAAAAQRVALEHDVTLFEVVLVAPQTVPKTSSGKIMRAATRSSWCAGTLEVLARWGASVAVDVVKPDAGEVLGDLTELEVAGRIQRCVARVLGVNARAVPSSEPLLRFGIDSLRAMQLQGELARDLGVVVPLAPLLAGESVLDLARHATQAPRVEPLAEISEGDAALPLTVGQRALWYLHNVDPENCAYHIARALRMHGLDVDRWVACVHRIVARHAALRSVFSVDDAGEPHQRALTPELRGDVRVVDATCLSEEQLRDQMTREARAPFALARAPGFRAIVWAGAGHATVMLVAHHIVADFWSLALVLEELIQLYESDLHRPAQSTDSAASRAYGDWVRRALRRSADAEGLAYWREQFAAPPVPLDLMPDYAPTAGTRGRGASVPIRLPADLSRSLEQLAMRHEVSLFVLLIAAWYLVLNRRTGSRDLTVAVPSANRSDPGDSGVVGYLVNMLPLRVLVDPRETVASFVARVRETANRALQRQHVPLAQIVEALGAEAARSRLFDSVFALQDTVPGRSLGVAALAVELEGAHVLHGALRGEVVGARCDMGQFDLAVSLARIDGTIAGGLDYDTGSYSEPTVTAILRDYAHLLSRLVQAPESRVSAIVAESSPDDTRTLERWDDTAVDYSSEPWAHESFRATAREYPDAICIVHRGRTLTYRELDDASDRLALRLRSLGLGPERVVAGLFERSIESVTFLLGALKAGVASLVLDVALPTHRARQYCELAKAAALVVEAEAVPLDGLRGVAPIVYLRDVIERPSGSDAPGVCNSVCADTLAYVIFTSGTTGEPKGVMVSHGALRNKCCWQREATPLGPQGALLHNTPYSFDVGLWEIWTVLTARAPARLVITDARRHMDAEHVVEQIRSHGVTLLAAVPALLAALLEQGQLASCTSLEVVISGGEVLSHSVRAALREQRPEAVLFNYYGPSECTVDSTWHRCSDDDDARRPIPIGVPVANVRALVLDEDERRVAPGVAGQLFLAGESLARGYLAQPGLTAERFLPNPWALRAGERMYATGDRVRHLPDGKLEFLGRRDRQVKIGGARVELAEVERAIRDSGHVRDVAVSLQPTLDTLQQLLAQVEALSDAGGEHRLGSAAIGLEGCGE